MKRLMLASVMVLSFAGGVALGKVPPPPKPLAGQGHACSAKQKCDGSLVCVAHGSGGSTCEIPCGPDTKCPEDQRCVKDGAHMLCRAITDLSL